MNGRANGSESQTPKNEPGCAWRAVWIIALPVMLLLLALAILYSWASWKDYRLRRELRDAGPAFFAGQVSSSIILVAGADDEAIPALQWMVQHRVPRTLEFTEPAGITDRSMRVVGEMHWLRNLNLSGTAITDDGLKWLAELNELESLSLMNTNVTCAGLEHLSGMRSLRDVYVGGTCVTSHGLARLVSQVPSLQNSTMKEAIEQLRQNIVLGTDDTSARPFLERLIELQEPTQRLSLRGRALTDRSLELVGRMTWLRELFLSDTSVTDKGLRSLEGLRQLETLSLHETVITDDGLQALRTLPSLKAVRISGTGPTSSGLERLMKQLPSLQNPDMQEYLDLLRRNPREKGKKGE